MALHFNLQINMVPFGQVYIRRLNKNVVPGKQSDYEFEVTLNGQLAKGHVKHYYGDGALVLVGLVVEEANRILTDKETPM